MGERQWKWIVLVNDRGNVKQAHSAFRYGMVLQVSVGKLISKVNSTAVEW